MNMTFAQPQTRADIADLLVDYTVADMDRSNPLIKQYNTPLYAQISQQAYQDVDSRAPQIEGFAYLQDLSTPEQAVYRNATNRHVVIAPRGTSVDKALAEDLKADSTIAAGLFDPILNPFANYRNRYEREKTNAKRVFEQYGDEEITFSGHSLGSKLGQDMGLEFGKRHVGFSTGAGLPTWNDLKCALPWNHCPESINHVKIGDPLSNFGRPFQRGSTEMTHPDTMNPHGIDQFVKPL